RPTQAVLGEEHVTAEPQHQRPAAETYVVTSQNDRQDNFAASAGHGHDDTPQNHQNRMYYNRSDVGRPIGCRPLRRNPLVVHSVIFLTVSSPSPWTVSRSIRSASPNRPGIVNGHRPSAITT